MVDYKENLFLNFMDHAVASFAKERPTVAQIRRYVLNQVDHYRAVKLVCDHPDILTWRAKYTPSTLTPANLIRSILCDLIQERLKIERTKK